jgi:phosphate starvation-inducible protein PhoH
VVRHKLVQRIVEAYDAHAAGLPAPLRDQRRRTA